MNWANLEHFYGYPITAIGRLATAKKPLKLRGTEIVESDNEEDGDEELDLAMREADVAIRMQPPRQADLVQRQCCCEAANAATRNNYLIGHRSLKPLLLTILSGLAHRASGPLSGSRKNLVDEWSFCPVSARARLSLSRR